MHRECARKLRSEVNSAGLFAYALIGLFLSPACSTRSVTPQAARIDPVPVTVATVIQETVPVEHEAIGNVEAYSTVAVKSQVEGQVERVHFREGQDVKKGDLLFTIDPRPFEASLKQAEANLAKDTAEATHARVEAERYTKLVDQGIVSKEQYDRFRSSADALEAAVAADRAAIDRAKLQLGYCTIRSPLDGRTGSVIIHEGNVVKANDVTLVVINQLNPIYVNFSVPEKYLAEIKSYMGSKGNLHVQALVPSDEAHPQQGRLTFVDNIVDTGTGTIRLKGTFQNQEKRLWPGQFVNVRLKLASQPNAVVIPSQAVQTSQQGQYVFVIESDVAQARPVSVGRSLGAETVIEQGLRAGEKVVTDGQLRLAPGAKVEIKNPS